ncbi:MAG: hypothetical protein ACI924_001597, partial [Flavobacterium sp.]
MIFEVLGYYFLVDTYFIMKKSYPNPTISSNSNALLNSFKKQLFFIFAFFAITTLSFGQSSTTYTTSGTFTVPAGVTSITIDCIGAGGAGGSGRNSNDQGAGGGAGGQYARSTISVSPGQVYTVTVAGITAAPNNNNYVNGNAGGLSEVTLLGTIHVRANGGNGGQAANIAPRIGGVGNTSGAIGNVVVRSGGNGGNGTTTASGAGGGGAGTTANGGFASGVTPGTGSTLFGGNGAVGYTSNSDGGTGSNYGGGGSGARRSNTGGNGAQGYVQINYTLPACVTPSTQPTALVLTPNLTSVNGNFTASASANGYLIIRTTSATAPTNPTNGTSYTAGTNALGGFIVQSNNATTFTDSPLTSGTQYWYWVFAYNSGCSGQPQYRTTSPLTNNTTTHLNVPASGNNSIVTCSGTLYDNGGSAGNYANNSNGYTVINPSVVGNFSTVTGSITAEGGYDYMTIYDGVGTAGTILWGGFPHGSGTSCTTIAVPSITSLTGSLTVQFYSDGSNNCTGFNLTISCSTIAGIPVYCTPTTSQTSVYISGVRAVGTLADASNLPTTYSTSGYGNYSGITIASQAPLGPVNIEINLAGSSQFIKTYVDWNNDYDFNDANELVYDTGSIATGDTTYGFIIPSGVVAGNYRMRIKTRAFISSASTITPCNSYDYGETEDYTLNIVNDCAAKITSVTDGSNCGTGTVTLGAVSTGSTTGYNWYANSTDTVPLATTATGSWNTPSISTTRTYYVTAINASPCESLIKTPVKATIKPTTNITFTPAAPIVCGDNTIITISASGDTEEVNLINEGFEGGLGIFSSTTPTNTNGGADSPWSIKTSTYQPTTTTVFKPALSSGSIGNRFAFTTSDYQDSNIETNLTTTASINTSTFTSLTLTFRHYYSYFGGDSGRVQVSTDGGGTWTNPNVIATYNSDLGSPSKFQDVTISMNAYIGQSNIKIRFNYRATWDDGWAIDDVRLFGTKPLTAAFTWSGATVDAYIDASATIPYTTQSVSNLYIKPTAAQLELASWTFTGTVTLSNGCSVSSPLTVTNNTKVWQGVTTNWNVASNWKPNGIPTINSCVVIPNNTVISGAAYTAYGKNLRVKSAGGLNIQPSNNLIIADEIIVEP